MGKRILALLTALIMLFTFAGCGEGGENKGQQEAEGAINIACITNLTGDYAMYGVPVTNAVQMYFEQINNAGGINGKKVNIISYDDKGDGTEAVNAFNLSMEQNISAVFGSVLTGATIALADATYDENVPQITASATSPGVTLLDPDNPSAGIRSNVFRTCFLDPFQGEKMAAYAESVGAKKAAIFYQNGSDYSEAVVAGIEDKLKECGIEIADKEAFSEGDKDFKAQMTNIAASGAEIVLMPIYYGEAGLAITALRAAGCDAKVVGSDGFGSVAKYASKEDLEGTVYFSGYAPGTDSVADFEKDYKEKYGEEVPNMFAPLAWDACLVLHEGLKNAENEGLTPGTDEYREAVIEGMKAVNGLEGITGNYVFNEYNNPIKSAALIMVKDGNEEFVKFF